MKTSFLKIPLLTVALSLLVLNVFSQTEDSEKFTQFVKQTFEKNLNNLENGNNIAPFLKAFSEDVVWEAVEITTVGNVKQRQFSKNQLRNRLMLSGHTPSLYVKWKITNFNQLKVREKTIFATFETESSVHAGETVLSKGKNILQIIATPINDTYIITFISTVQVADKIYKGECFVNIQKKEGNQYSVNTHYPSGTDYSTISHTVEFTGTEKSKMVTLKNEETKNVYYWNNMTNSLSKEKLNGPQIASATTEEQAIIQLVKIQQKDQCLEMVRSYKKVTKN